MEFASALLNAVGAFYNAADDAALHARGGDIRARFVQLESVLGDGVYFAGARFSVVDAAFAPVFRYFDVFDRLGDFGFFDGLPKVRAWRAALAARESVRRAVRDDYPALLRDFLRRRPGSALAQRVGAALASTR